MKTLMDDATGLRFFSATPPHVFSFRTAGLAAKILFVSEMKAPKL